MDSYLWYAILYRNLDTVCADINVLKHKWKKFKYPIIHGLTGTIKPRKTMKVSTFTGGGGIFGGINYSTSALGSRLNQVQREVFYFGILLRWTKIAHVCYLGLSVKWYVAEIRPVAWIGFAVTFMSQNSCCLYYFFSKHFFCLHLGYVISAACLRHSNRFSNPSHISAMFGVA